MKYYRAIDSYGNSTKTNLVNLGTRTATSYTWWQYLAPIGSKLVFNSYSYSNTTARHQSDTLQLLRDKNIAIDLYVECPKGLQDLESGILLYKDRIAALRAQIQAPRSREAKNRDRAQDISNLHLKILELRALGLVSGGA